MSMQNATQRPQRCRSCGALILWLRHEESGKTAPVDAEQNPLGNILVNRDAGTYRIVPAAARDANRDWLHTNHFATCKDAPTWKGGTR
jgi:hypothetical protein